MTPAITLCLVAAWFVLGMTRIVVTSKLAEHRIDRPDVGKAMSNDRAARAERLDEANYDLPGRRLLPWYRAVNTTYWVMAGCGCCWVALHG